MLGQWNIVLPCEFTSKINHICPGQKWNTLMTLVPVLFNCWVPALSDKAGQWDTNCILCCAGPESSFTAKHCLQLGKHTACILHSGEGYRVKFRFHGLYQGSEQVTIQAKQDSSRGICSKTLHKMLSRQDLLKRNLNCYCIFFNG